MDTHESDDFKIAVIGMAARFPGAADVDEFWRNLRDGKESLRPIDPAAMPKNPPRGYVHAGSLLDDADKFDAVFFRCTPREAQLMDPQHRVFLECAWTAFEHAGYSPAAQSGRVAVYAGTSYGTYLLRNLASHPEYYRTSALQALMLYGTAPDYLCTRVSYKLNLTGPSVAVQTACSSSLVAIHMAAESLLAHHCDVALAGGVSVRVPQEEGYEYEDGGMLSPDGHCRPFSADSGGTVFGSGAGAVVLKRYKDALRDGDCVHAVVLGSAINNDGGNRVGYTAPSAAGQTAVIHEALEVAGVDARTIGYVEAHGTATKLGDPIEVSALTTAFRSHSEESGFCAIGSVKGNVGHLNAAAGVAGFIKAALAVRDGCIPPTINLGHPNPRINFAATPFRPAAQLADWAESESPRRAGVSSFGVGGTNAHAIVEQPPRPAARTSSGCPQVLVVSAATPEAADQLVDRLGDYLRQADCAELRDVAHTLQVGRGRYPYRRAVAAASSETAATALLAPLEADLDGPARRVVWMLPGGGVAGAPASLVRDLVRGEPAALRAFEECAQIVRSRHGWDLLATLDRDEDASRNAAAFEFAVEYALASLWGSWGVKPDGLVGSGIGEFVAGCLAEVFSLDTALHVVGMLGTQSADALIAAMAQSALKAPRLSLVSSVTGDWLTREQAQNARYWAEMLLSSVQPDVDRLLARALTSGAAIFLEVGVGGELTRQACAKSHVAVASLADSAARADLQLRKAVAQLWLTGIEPQWDKIRRSEPVLRAALPTYPFARARHWIEPRVPSGAEVAGTLSAQPQSASASLAAVATNGAQSPVAQIVTGIFAELLGVPEVPIDASFFELGGNSLMATQVLSRIQQEFAVDLPISKVFAAPTVGGLVDLVEEEFSAKLAAMSDDEIGSSLRAET